MTEYTYPGVYWKEVSGAPGPIAGVTTSTLGLIGWTSRGEVDEPTLVTNFAEFTSAFGTFTEKGITPTEAYAFFQNGGQRLYVVRVTHSDALDSYCNYTYTIPTATPDDLGNTVEASGIYSLQLSNPPVIPGTFEILFNDAGTDNTFEDAASDGVLTAKAGGGGSGGSGFINYTTGEVSVTLTVPGDYSGGVATIDAEYEYTIFKFEMKWPGVAGNYHRVVIEPGSSDYLTAATASYTRFTVSVQEDTDAGVTGVPSWSTVEQFLDLSFSDPTSSSYVVTVMNADIGGSSYVEVAEYGNEMNPTELAGVATAAEDFSATMIHSDASSVVTPDYYNGKWKGWTYDLANDVFPTTFLASFTFDEGGPLMAAAATPAAATVTIVGPDAFDTTLLPIAMNPLSPSVRISCQLTAIGHTSIIDIGAVGAGNLVEASTGIAVGTINYTTGAISNPAGAVANQLDVSGLTVPDTFVAASEIHWVNGARIGTGGGAVTAPVVSLGTVAAPAAITPGSVKISCRAGDTATNTGITITATFGGGTVTLADSSNPFGSTVAGDIIVVSGATAPANDGTFIVTSVAALGASVDYENAAGVAQPVGAAGTSWSTLGQWIEIIDTGAVGVGNLVSALAPAEKLGTIDYTTGAISDDLGTLANTLDLANLTATNPIFVAGFPINIEASYAQPVDIEDDGDGNLSVSATQAVGYPQKFTLDANGTNELTYTSGAFTLTWALTGAPSAGPASASAQLCTYYTDLVNAPADSVINALASGSDGSSVDSNDLVSATLTADERGIWAFGKVDSLMQLVASDFQTDITVSGALITYAELVKDKFVILTVPAGLTPQEAVNWKKFQLQNYTSYAAIYYPHIKITDPVTEVVTDIPCGGHVAGVYARTDSTQNVGKAPGGTADGKLNWSVGLELDLTPTQVGVVYQEKINALVQWPHTGRCVWGVKTMDIAGGEFGYIQQRRLFMYVEKSVFNATHSHIFKNNGPSLWGAIRAQITNFLLGLYQGGYLAGNSADEAFFVICDRSNNPQNTVDQGIVFCDVGIATNKPAEFLVFKFQQLALA